MAFFVRTFYSNQVASYVFAHFQIHLESIPNSSSNTSSRTIPTFLTLYIFGFLYQLVLVWDALRMKNTIQVIGLVMYNVGLLIYGAVQMDQIRDAILELAEDDYIRKDIWSDTEPYLIAIPSILAVGTVLMAGCAWKLYDEFAWTIYKRISADLRMKRRYLQYQIYITVLKFDFFFFLGFTVQFVVIVKGRGPEFALTIAAIPVTIFILLAAAWFVRKESLIGSISVIVSPAISAIQTRSRRLISRSRSSISAASPTSSSRWSACTLPTGKTHISRHERNSRPLLP
jgi:hypothetical protein